MASHLKYRLARLEQRLGTADSKHFLFVEMQAGEDRETAIARVAAERGIAHDRIGHVVLLGPGEIFADIDYGGHEGMNTLIGYGAFQDTMKRLLADIDTCPMSRTQGRIVEL